MDTRALEKIGLTKNQSQVYLSLLKLGSSTAQEIIKESGMHRSRVYDSLEKLQEYGLVSFVIKDYKKYFQPASPQKLFSFLDDKKEALIEIMPNLKKLDGMKKEEINASIYKGKEGLKTIHSEMIKEGSDIYVFGGKGLIFTELEYFVPNFERERIRKKIKWKILWDKKEAKKKMLKKILVEAKILPRGFESKGVINIFGNKVAIVLWREKYPSAFMIESKDIADSFRKWFRLLYNKI